MTKYGDNKDKFDVSDVEVNTCALELRPIDNVSDVLDVACGVLADYGDDPGDTRVERMARWIVLNMAVEVGDERAGAVSILTVDDMKVHQAGEHISAPKESPVLSAEHARRLATALLMAAERADED